MILMGHKERTPEHHVQLHNLISQYQVLMRQRDELNAQFENDQKILEASPFLQSIFTNNENSDIKQQILAFQKNIDILHLRILGALQNVLPKIGSRFNKNDLLTQQLHFIEQVNNFKKIFATTRNGNVFAEELIKSTPAYHHQNTFHFLTSEEYVVVRTMIKEKLIQGFNQAQSRLSASLENVDTKRGDIEAETNVQLTKPRPQNPREVRNLIDTTRTHAETNTEILVEKPVLYINVDGTFENSEGKKLEIHPITRIGLSLLNSGLNVTDEKFVDTFEILVNEYHRKNQDNKRVLDKNNLKGVFLDALKKFLQNNNFTGIEGNIITKEDLPFRLRYRAYLTLDRLDIGGEKIELSSKLGARFLCAIAASSAENQFVPATQLHGEFGVEKMNTMNSRKWWNFRKELKINLEKVGIPYPIKKVGKTKGTAYKLIGVDMQFDTDAFARHEENRKSPALLKTESTELDRNSEDNRIIDGIEFISLYEAEMLMCAMDDLKRNLEAERYYVLDDVSDILAKLRNTDTSGRQSITTEQKNELYQSIIERVQSVVNDEDLLTQLYDALDKSNDPRTDVLLYFATANDFLRNLMLTVWERKHENSFDTISRQNVLNTVLTRLMQNGKSIVDILQERGIFPSDVEDTRNKEASSDAEIEILEKPEEDEGIKPETELEADESISNPQEALQETPVAPEIATPSTFKTRQEMLREFEKQQAEENRKKSDRDRKAFLERLPNLIPNLTNAIQGEVNRVAQNYPTIPNTVLVPEFASSLGYRDFNKHFADIHNQLFPAIDRDNRIDLVPAIIVGLVYRDSKLREKLNSFNGNQSKWTLEQIENEVEAALKQQLRS